MVEHHRDNLLATHKYLKTTGILDAYQHVMQTLSTKGWPQDKSLFDHAAYELLKWHSEHKDEVRPTDNTHAFDYLLSTGAR